MRYTRHALAELNNRYRNVLIKCALMNALAAAVMLGTTPAMAVSGWNATDADTNVSDIIHADTYALGGGDSYVSAYEGKFKKHYTDHTALLNVRYNF